MSGENETTPDWQYDADEHERQQMLRDAQRPLADKLRWLEEAHRLVLQLQKNTPPQK